VTDAAPDPPAKSRRRLLIFGCVTPPAVLLLAAIGVFVFWRPFQGDYAPPPPTATIAAPAWVPAGKRFEPWAAAAIVYDGPGALDAYEPYACRAGDARPDPAAGVLISGRRVRCLPGFASTMVPSPRQLLVHLPAGYDDAGEPLPLVISLHGFGQRSVHAFMAFVDFLDAAEASGRIPKVIAAFPDFSIGGDGLDNLATPWDENGGAWGVNSSIGRYQDHFWQELLPFLLSHYRASDQPRKTVLLGGSMGGSIALNFMLDDPARLPLVGAFYPALDLRYSCGGDRLAPYDPKCYRPLTDNKPNRRMSTETGLKGRLFTERYLLYPIFNAGEVGGPPWPDKLPMWQRIRRRNPIDRLRDEKPNLTGVHLWYLVGDHDAFNIFSEAPEFDKEARKLGMSIEPVDHVRPGGHDAAFYREHVNEALDWMAAQLKN